MFLAQQLAHPFNGLVLRGQSLTFVVCGLLTLGAIGCSRAGLPMGDGTFESPCQTTADCSTADRCQTRTCVEGFCRVTSEVTCDDFDECTSDRCEPSTGLCAFSPRTSDEDGDGHRAFLLGTRPGEAGSCGDDCDDTSSDAFPGGLEYCDGADNDCNGVIDDNGAYNSPTAPVLVSTTGTNEAIPAGFAYANGTFAVTTTQRDERWRGYFQAVEADGSPVVRPIALTLEASDGMGGPLVWTGALFGTAWEDRRDRSYDIYFNRLDPLGKKLGPDIRVTNNEGFTVSPSLLWDGEGFLLAYSDETDNGTFRILARRLNHDGSVIGEAIVITDWFTDARGPRFVRTERGLSVFYNAIGDGFYLQRLNTDLTPLDAPVRLPLADPGEVSIRWNLDRYLVAWSQKTQSVGQSIWAVTLDERGDVIAEPTAIVSGRSMARSPSWVALGDRAFLVWADDYDHYGTFELSGQMRNNRLESLGDRVKLTNLYADTFDPSAVIGGANLGVVFRSRTRGNWQTFFLSLGCVERLD